MKTLGVYLVLLVVLALGSSRPIWAEDSETEDQSEEISTITLSEQISRQEEQRTHIDLMRRWRSKVKSVCANKKVQISSLSEMLLILDEIQRDQRRCPKRYHAAVFELAALLLRRRERLCEPTTFDMIKQYHFRFIQPMKRPFNKPPQIIKGQLHPEARIYTLRFDEQDQILMAPKSVRLFFLKFALQVSHQCKMDLVRNLVRDQERVLAPGDLQMMAPFGAALLSDHSEQAARLMLDFDNVLYIPELDGPKQRPNGERYKPTGGNSQRALRTNADESSRLYRMIEACKLRFKPMYDALILPIVRLSKLGYDYQGPMGWSPEERAFLTGELMQDWLVIVHVCEMFKHTHLVAADNENPSTPQDEGGGGCLLEVVGEEEVAREEQMSAPPSYRVVVRFEMSDELLIDGERDLDLELSRKFGASKESLMEKILRRLANYPKRALARVDPDRFAHYRHNSNWYTGIIKFLSSWMGLIAMGFTIHGFVTGR